MSAKLAVVAITALATVALLTALAVLTGIFPKAHTLIERPAPIATQLELGTALYCTNDGLTCWESAE